VRDHSINRSRERERESKRDYAMSNWCVQSFLVRPSMFTRVVLFNGAVYFIGLQTQTYAYAYVTLLCKFNNE